MDLERGGQREGGVCGGGKGGGGCNATRGWVMLFVWARQELVDFKNVFINMDRHVLFDFS